VAPFVAEISTTHYALLDIDVLAALYIAASHAVKIIVQGASPQRLHTTYKFHIQLQDQRTVTKTKHTDYKIIEVI